MNPAVHFIIGWYGLLCMVSTAVIMIVMNVVREVMPQAENDEVLRTMRRAMRPLLVLGGVAVVLRVLEFTNVFG